MNLSIDLTMHSDMDYSDHVNTEETQMEESILGAEPEDVEMDVDELRAALAQAKEELENAHMEIETWQKKAEAGKKDVDSYEFILKDQKARSAARIQELQKENIALNGQLAAMQRQKAAEERVFSDTLNDMNFESNQRMKGITADLAVAKGELQRAKETAEAITQEFNAKLADSKAELQTVKETAEATIQELNAKLADAQAELQAVKETADATIQELNNLRAEQEQLKKELDTAEEARREYSEEVFKLSAKLFKLAHGDIGSPVRSAIDLGEVAAAYASKIKAMDDAYEENM